MRASYEPTRRTGLSLCLPIFPARLMRSSIGSFRSSRNAAFSEPIMNRRRFAGTSAFRVRLMRRRRHSTPVLRGPKAEKVELARAKTLFRVPAFRGCLKARDDRARVNQARCFAWLVPPQEVAKGVEMDCCRGDYRLSSNLEIKDR